MLANGPFLVFLALNRSGAFWPFLISERQGKLREKDLAGRSSEYALEDLERSQTFPSRVI